MFNFVRFSVNHRTAYGLLQADGIHELSGDLFDTPIPTGAVHVLDSVQLLYPCQPTKIVCVGLNYRPISMAVLPRQIPRFSINRSRPSRTPAAPSRFRSIPSTSTSKANS